MSSRIVAQRAADGMVLSTANIYFTAHDGTGARVFRTAQSATPGQEAELCHEPNCRFGDIVFAKVDNVFYGYFFALTGGRTTVRRIPLAPQPGQAAEIISPPIADIDIVSSHGNLITDGSFLYWQSDTAINKMPIRGGSVTVLDRTPLTRPVAGLHLLGSDVIYAVDRVVYHVPANGSAITQPALRVVFTAATGIVAFVPLANAIFVAERNGAIVSRSGTVSGVNQPPGGAFITSLAYDTAHLDLIRTQMTSTWAADVDTDNGLNHFRIATGANPRLVMFNAAGDLFWLDDNGVATSPVLSSQSEHVDGSDDTVLAGLPTAGHDGAA
jgi:hypothetical protein